MTQWRVRLRPSIPRSPFPPHMSVKASVVVVTYGQRAVTERGLNALAAALGEQLGRAWELVLVDNASPDDTPALLQQWSDRAEVLLLERNLDFAGGCNAGAARARGDVLVFLNNDTEVVPGALEALVEQVGEPGVALAGPRLLFPDGTIQHAGVGFLRNALGVMPQHVFHHQDGMLPAVRGVYELDCVTGACLVIRREVFEQLGGFDEGYRNGLEDVDLCLRARMAGHRVVYRGDIAFVHAEGASRGAGSDLWATPERLSAMRSNDLRFIGAWGAMLDEDVELAAATWDAELHEVRPTPAAGPASVVVEGQPGGLAPAGDEARAILAACAAAGPLAAARDEPFPRVAPRLDPSLRALVRDALGREPLPGAARIVVPAGARAVHALDGAVLRAGVVPAGGGEPTEVWAPAADVAAAFAAAGLPEHRMHVVAPALQPLALGEGGEGVLAILPAHDARACEATLRALRGVPDVRLLPTVAARGLARAVGDSLPGAELLAPCADERRFAAIAGRADVVLAADPDDLFERRALIAAMTGATVVTTRRGGPAATFAGAHHDLAAALAQTDTAARADRRAVVLAATDPVLMGARVARLVERGALAA
jgi:GT2 family glycosyltransferase